MSEATADQTMADRFMLADATYVTSLSLNEAFIKLSDLAASQGVKLTAIRLEVGRFKLTFGDTSEKEIRLDSPAAGAVPSAEPGATGPAVTQSQPKQLSDLACKVLKSARASMPPQAEPDELQRQFDEVLKAELDPKKPTQFTYKSDGNMFSIGIE